MLPPIELGVTRSAVSQGIRRLEDAFGTTLVTRTTRSVRLTGSSGGASARGFVAALVGHWDGARSGSG